MGNQNVVCSACGGKATADDAFCQQCGATLGEGGQFLRCSNGHILAADSRFCPWCGEKVGEAAASAHAQTMPMGAADTARQTLPMDAPAPISRRTVAIQPQQDVRRTVIKRAASGPEESPQAKVMGFLVSYTLTDAGFFLPLREGRQSIGSDAKSTMRVEDTMLSAEHAVILYRNGRFIFEDRLSSNGSFVNGKEAIGQMELKHGDSIIMGSHTYWMTAIPQDSSNDATE